MSTPDNKSDTQSKAKDFGTLVQEAVSSVSVNDKGETTFAEGTSEEVKYAANLELRRRETQASFTKNQQKLAATEAEKTELETMVRKNVSLNLTDEQKEELDDLKFSDPDAWRTRMDRLENEARAIHEAAIEEKLKEVSSKGSKESELEYRKRALQEFTTNSGIEITDEVLANDVPPRITRELDEGKVTFDEFLKNVATYLTSGKVIKDEDAPNMANLSQKGGGESAQTAQGGKTKPNMEYKNVTF